MQNIEAINFLTGSVARWQILTAVAAEPRTFRQLREDLDVPQSTLNRNLTKLEERGWVREQPDRTHELTSLGTFFVERLRPLEDVLIVVEQMAEYPDAFPLQEFGFNLALLAEADWRVAGENEPYRIINRVRAVFEGATTVRGITPHYNPAYIDVSERLAQRDGGRVVGMVPDHQLDAAIEDDHFDLGQFGEQASVEFRVWDGDIDYGIAIIDEETVIYTGEHQGGMPSIMFETDNEAVVTWTKTKFEEIQDRSKKIA